MKALVLEVIDMLTQSKQLVLII